MSSLDKAIEIPDSSDDEGLKPPPASSPENAIEIPDSSDDEGSKSLRVIAAPKPKPNPFSLVGGAKPTAKAKTPPPPFPSWSTAAPPAAARRAPVGVDDPCRKCKRTPPETTFSCFLSGARKSTCDACLPPSKKRRGPDGQAVVAAASVPSPPPVTSTTEHCTVPKCTDSSCRRLHQCGAKGRGCKHRFLWLESEAFGSKCGGSKRNLYCNECTALAKKKNAINNPIYNPINNAQTAAKKMQERIAYEEETLGDEHDLSPEGLKAHRDAAISRAEELIRGYDVTYPEGYAVIFYGASTGSEGYTVVKEGVNQLRQRSKNPPIIDASRRAPDVALTSAWGPGGVSVYDCGSSTAISRVVEKALHEHFWPICDASDGKMLRLWRACGAGAPQGIGPYHVCIRIMPLPMPHGWRRGF